jgi:hypothetical protein
MLKRTLLLHYCYYFNLNIRGQPRAELYQIRKEVKLGEGGGGGQGGEMTQTMYAHVNK